MSFLKNLFGKKENEPEIIPTAEMLDEDQFWKIIELSLQKTNDQEDQETYLPKEIEKLTAKEIIGFRLRTDKLLHDTYTSEMWCAGYIMNGGCSDDGFEYFRCWIISRGKKVYCSAKANPDSLISEVIEDAEYYDFEGFWYVALTAFENKTGLNLYDFIDHDNFKIGEGSYPPIEFNWKEEDPDSMKAICPNLFERFWN